MSFDTVSFWLFFILIFFVYHSLKNYKQQNILLLIASYFFYGIINPAFLLIIFISTLTDFICGHFAHKVNSLFTRRISVLMSLLINLSLLISFKYILPFQTNSINYLPEAFVKYGIPLGISFYTFQTLSYTLDVYNGRLRPHYNFLNFALFVSFFPQLIAGPIEKAKNLLPQIIDQRILKKDGGTFNYKF